MTTEVYKIAANLSITGDAHKKMLEFLKLTEKAALATKNLNAILKNTSRNFDYLTNSFPKINNNFAQYVSTLRMAEGDTMRLNHQTDRLKNSLRSVAAAAQSTRHLVGGNMGGGGGGGGRRVGFGAGAGGAFISKFGLPLSGGAALGYGGAALIKAGWHQGSEYNRNVAQIAAMGYSSSQIGEAQRLTSSAKPGMSTVTQIEMFKDALMATHSFDMAKELYPILAQGKFTASSLGHGITEKQIADAIRSAEMMGGSDHKKVMSSLNNVLMMSALSGFTINPGAQRAFWTQASGSMSRITDKGYLSLEPVMQELGPSKLGTALTTGIRAFSNPQMAHFARYQTKALEKMGMWDSGTNRMKSEYIEMLQTDPTQFAKTWLTQLSAHGVNSPSAILTETMADFPRTFGNALMLMIKNMDKTDRMRARYDGLPKANALFSLGMDSNQGHLKNLIEQWNSFAAAFGKFTNPSVLSGMDALANFFKLLANHMGSTDQITHTQTWGQIGSSLIHGKFHDTIFGGSNVTNTGGGKGVIQVNSKITVDGRDLAHATTTHIVDTANTTVQHGTSWVNTLGSPIPSGINSLGSQL